MTEVREASQAELVAWDETVALQPNCRVVHQRAWLEALEAYGYGRPLYLVITRTGEPVAWLPGLLVDIGPFRLFGSTLPGWQTVSMGPVFDPARVSTADMMGALLPYLEREQGVDHAEILSSALDRETMVAQGFRGQAVPTYVAPLFPGDETRSFRAMKESARRNVRRGERLGLRVSFESDESFVDEHYAQLDEVYRRGGNRINFTRRRVLECYRRLKAAGHLVTVSVYLPNEPVCIASGMFTIFRRELLLWTWAHRTRYRSYYPTELMTWSVMTRAMAAGCESFDFMGRGDFKAKFGAAPVDSKIRWVRSRYRWLTAARDLAERGSRLRMAVLGQLSRRLAGEAESLVAASPAPAAGQP